MSGKWVQAENGRDEHLDVFVWVETPDPITGTATIAERLDVALALLGPDGLPIRQSQKHPMGFGKP